jgi:hypothetical protein
MNNNNNIADENVTKFVLILGTLFVISKLSMDALIIGAVAIVIWHAKK